MSYPWCAPGFKETNEGWWRAQWLAPREGRYHEDAGRDQCHQNLVTCSLGWQRPWKCTGRTAARAACGEAGMPWEDRHPALPSPFLPPQTQPVHWDRSRRAQASTEKGRYFCFVGQGVGRELANRKYHHMHIQSCLAFTYIMKDPKFLSV